MKNIFSIYFFIFFFIVNVSFAQKNKYEIGFESGPSLIKLRPYKNYPITVGFAGGFFGQININKSLSLRSNLHFDRKGYSTGKIQNTTQFGQIIGTANYITNYDYLTLPILVRANFGRKINFFVNAGPYFGYLINTRTIVQSKVVQNFVSYVKYADLAKSDIGISTGVGFYLPLISKLALSFELRNNLGLANQNIRNGPENNTTSVFLNITRSFKGNK
jgi:Outer membrane protein beta-barrel domain